MDGAVAAGRFESRAAAVREALERLLADEQSEGAEAYRRAYSEQPEDEAFGQAGLILMAESIAELERSAGKASASRG